MSINEESKGGQEGGSGVTRDLGQRLRAARTRANVGLRQLARQIGVSPGLISQVESGRTAPSVATIYAIATALNLSFDYLFVGAQSGEPAMRSSVGGVTRVQPQNQRPTVRLASGVRWEHLTWSSRNDFEFLNVVYERGGASCEEGILLQHGGTEFAFMLSGSLGLSIGGESFHLSPGDSISFDAQTPHRIWNTGEEPARAVWVVLQRRFDDRQALPSRPAPARKPGARVG